MYQSILYSVIEKKCSITINRAEKRNAFNAELVEELKAAFRKAESDEKVKVIILTGAGDVFSAGADLAYLQSLQNNSLEENTDDSKRLTELYMLIYTLQKPVIAKINGHAIAGGCGLATVCDFAISVSHAQFGYTEVKIGFVPAIVMVFLLRKISETHAKELLLTGKLIDANTALQYNMINKVVSAAELDDAVNVLAEELIQNTSRSAVQITKLMIAQVQELSLDDAIILAAQINAKARATKDCKYGIQSFLEKKKPIWE
ncbi:MAG: enoyl-CoA hydratase-related protein [Chitinophagales bacterium]|nr:enoyl-CoA hydratase/isomerase family protein [Bacteroidota bacterium]MBK8681982.1 enoyl-CoA hydratase/isomerase family protein [Bacteroidota bacterium]